jgi:hypothetical protein
LGSLIRISIALEIGDGLAEDWQKNWQFGLGLTLHRQIGHRSYFGLIKDPDWIDRFGLI